MKRRKKKWTTKNTHLKKGRKEKRDEKSNDRMSKIIAWMCIVLAILIILLGALDNHIVGYDFFIGCPPEWRRSLLK